MTPGPCQNCPDRQTIKRSDCPRWQQYQAEKAVLDARRKAANHREGEMVEAMKRRQKRRRK